ncbi:MAG: hypothetical protein HYV93_23885 [Candidatus Rokubacteria bacterium]|nr:hypothetical protein [Candidatus Rokubacteria bacterium]
MTPFCRRPPLLAVLALALSATLAPLAPAWAQPGLPATSLEALAASLYGQVAALRGMPNPGPPPPVVIRSREESRRFIEEELDRRYAPLRLEAERKALVAWGLIPADYDLRRLFLDLMEEQVSAYYDPRAKVMVLGDWLAPAQQQVALLHELVHALQDREISLDRFLAPVPGQGDRLLALQALVEGEAVGVMLDLVLRAQGSDFASLPDMSAVRGLIAAGSRGPVIQSAPAFLRDLLLFAYVEGLEFIHRFRKQHPWQAIGRLYRDPPRSTAQILHPEKRLTRREDPVPVQLPDLTALLPDARLVTEDELGEFGLGAVLGLHVGPQEGSRAAAGWRGDRYRVWEDGSGRFLVAWVVAMESKGAAEALRAALARVVEGRHPALAGRAARGGGSLVSWREGARAFVAERRGTRTILLEHIPRPAADRVREAIWRASGGAGTQRP